MREKLYRAWFKNGEFDAEDKELTGRPKLSEDAEFEAFLEELSC